MWKSNLITAIRFFQRNKTYSIINLFGLALGLAAFSLIFQYVLQETSFDSFHKGVERTYLMNMIVEREGSESMVPTASSGLGASLLEEFPDVECMCRVNMIGGELFSHGDQVVETGNYAYADSSFFRMFSFDLKEGNPAECLKEPYSIVLSESMAKRLFRDESDIVGKSIKLNNEHTFLISGIMADVPTNSTIRPQAVVSFESLKTMKRMGLGWNGGWGFLTYVRLHPEADMQQMSEAFPDFMERHINAEYRNYGIQMHLNPIPLEDVHLGKLADKSDGYQKIWIVSLIALSILLLAVINFTNLSTALFTKRKKEAGIRKVLGAYNGNLMRQHLTESMMMALLAFPLALILGEVFQPWISRLTNLNIGLYGHQSMLSIIATFLIAIIAGLLGGLYPARFIAASNPLEAFGRTKKARGNNAFRNVLVVIQFFIACVLICCTLIMHAQLRFLQSFDTGFDGSQMYIIQLRNDESKKMHDIICDNVRNISGVTHVGSSSGVPGMGGSLYGFFPEDVQDVQMMFVINARKEYLNTLNVPLLAGQIFPDNNDGKSILINQAAAQEFGWENPIGKIIKRNGVDMRVCGVLQDFVHTSAHNKIEPLIISPLPEWNPETAFEYISLRFKGDPRRIKEDLQKLWDEMLPDELFELMRPIDFNEHLYQRERQQSRLVSLFSGLAVFIAAIGLFGLALFIGRLRVRESAIRQVMGASSWQVHLLFLRQFILRVLIANALALPLSWYLMKNWLELYHYRIALSPKYFIITLVISTLIALISVMHQGYKSGRINPADVLKYE